MRAAPLLAILAAGLMAAGGYAYWTQQQALRVPEGLTRANGRIEVERVDIATKFAGRVAEIRVREGDAVPAAISSHAWTSPNYRPSSRPPKPPSGGPSKPPARPRPTWRSARRSSAFRGRTSPRGRTGTARRRFHRRGRPARAQNEVAKAEILGAKASVRDAQAAREAAEAHVAHIEATIADMTLKPPSPAASNTASPARARCWAREGAWSPSST